MKTLEQTLVRCLAADVLHLILLPTEACNFRCTYCYEDFRLGHMGARVVRGVKNLLSDRCEELSDLTLSWFGGEPLLALDVIEDVLGHVGRLRDRHPRIAFSSDVTTNGHLLDFQTFDRLLGLGVTRFQVSFDGPRELHDRVRRRADGGATFDRVFGNLCTLAEHDDPFEIHLRVHVDRENHLEIPGLLDDCAEAFSGDGRFRVFLRKLSRMGGPNDDLLPVFDDDDELAEVMNRLHGHAAERGLAQHLLPSEGPVTPCYASKANSFVVRADGRVNKCTVVLDHPRNQVGRLHESGRLELESGEVIPWMRGLRSGDKLHLMCPMIGLADPT